MWNFIKELKRKDHLRYLGGLDFFKYSRIYRSGELGLQFCGRF